MSSIEARERHGPCVSSDGNPIELRLRFCELLLIQRSLEAVGTLRLVERQDDLLADTIQLIDVALEEAA